MHDFYIEVLDFTTPQSSLKNIWMKKLFLDCTIINVLSEHSHGQLHVIYIKGYSPRL